MHSCGYLFYWFRRGGLAEVWNETTQWPRFGVNNLAGAIALFVGGGFLALSAHPVIRRKCYRCFYYGHLFGTTVFVLFASAHWTYSVFYFAPATLLWGAELAQRRRQQECAPTIVMASRISDTLLKLCVPLRGDGPFPISSTLSSNEYIYLRNCSSSKAHPFSALPSRDGKSMTVHLRAQGTWTKDVIESCGLVGSSYEPVSLPMWVQGPYSISFPDEAATGADLILVGTGTGIAPLIGLVSSRSRHFMCSTVQPPMTFLVLVCRSLEDLAMLESLPRHVPRLSIIVYHTGTQSEVSGTGEAYAAAALGRRQNLGISSQYSKTYASHGASGRDVFLFSIAVHFGALVGIWFGVIMTQGFISNWGHNPEVFMSKYQKEMMEMDSTPGLLQYDWIQGMLMLIGVNGASLMFALGTGAMFQFCKGLTMSKSQTGHDMHAVPNDSIESSDSDTEANPMLGQRSSIESDTLSLAKIDTPSDKWGDSTVSDNTMSTAFLVDEDESPVGTNLHIRQGRPNISSLLDECSELCDGRPRPLYLQSNIPLPLHVCASGHPSLVSDTKSACASMKKKLHAELRQNIIFTETSFDMSAI